jgi:dTMP kinase
MTSLFITFEGGEGAGKSTQVQTLRSALEKRGREVVVTREPGGTPAAEALRRLLLEGRFKAMGASAEALLFAAARADHVDALINPALERGAIVICDRFFDSTHAYQGAASGLAREELEKLDSLATKGLRPHLTFLLDLPPEKGMARAQARGQGQGTEPSQGTDRFEDEALAFHERVRAAFLARAQAEPVRMKIIDADRSRQDIAAEIWQHVLPMIT